MSPSLFRLQHEKLIILEMIVVTCLGCNTKNGLPAKTDQFQCFSCGVMARVESRQDDGLVDRIRVPLQVFEQEDADLARALAESEISSRRQQVGKAPVQEETQDEAGIDLSSLKVVEATTGASSSNTGIIYHLTRIMECLLFKRTNIFLIQYLHREMRRTFG